PVDRVRIDDNVICAADEKVIYAADWSPLAGAHDTRPGEVDALDVADLVDERAHDYELPAPHGGWVVGAVHPGPDGRARFDGGRIGPEGKSESFVVRDQVPVGPARLLLRTDAGPVTIEVSVAAHAAETVSLGEAEPPTTSWREVELALPSVARGDR